MRSAILTSPSQVKRRLAGLKCPCTKGFPGSDRYLLQWLMPRQTDNAMDAILSAETGAPLAIRDFNEFGSHSITV